MKHTLSSLPLLLAIMQLPAQPAIQWQKTVGGSDSERACAIAQTRDEGYITCGYTISNDGDIMSNNGLIDFLVVKFDKTGGVEWENVFGGSYNDWGYDVKQTPDDGYILTGFTLSDDGDVTGFHGYIDAWVVKLDSDGNLEWQKAIGGSGWDELWSVNLTNDGGYILAGRTNSPDGDVGGTYGGTPDLWLVKLGQSGNMQGREVLRQAIGDTAELYVSRLNKGLYFVLARCSDGTMATGRFVKE